jgi:hypothetical protein
MKRSSHFNLALAGTFLESESCLKDDQSPSHLFSTILVRKIKKIELDSIAE